MYSFLSICTTKVDATANGHKISDASGFFYMCQGRPFLITNRHVVTGRNNFTGKKIDTQNGIVPDGISFKTINMEKDGQGNYGFSLKTNKKYDMKWEFSSPPWYEHSTIVPAPDVVAFDLLSIFKDSEKNDFPCINSAKDAQKIKLSPAMPVSVIGYPFAKTIADILPVWVSGTIASEPIFDVDGIPAFYIDCRTNSGSSGSPILLYSPQGAVQLDEAPAKSSGVMMAMRSKDGNHYGTFPNPVHRLVGVYSGRINDQSDIGYAWRSEIIEEICSKGTIACKK